MATPIVDISDGIITGTIKAKREFCAHCSASVWCVQIDKVELPEGIRADPRLIAYQTQVAVDGNFIGHVRYLGLTCSCYAKFHRQLAHIQGGKK
jgi:hypothetical protein